MSREPDLRVGPVTVRDRATRSLVDELTAELAAQGYTEDQTVCTGLDLA